MNRKKLLVITSTFPRWPKDTDPPFVYELAKRLVGTFDITVLAPGFPGALDREELAGLTVYRFRYFFRKLEQLAGTEGILPTLRKKPLFNLVVPFFLLGEFRALLRLARNLKPDVIHAHWVLPQGLVAALVGEITGIRFAVTAHGGDIYAMRGKFATVLKRFTLRNAGCVTVVSQNIQSIVKRKFGDNTPTKVISMGVDSQLFSPARKNPALRKRYGLTGPFLLFVGRLTEKKGTRYLLEAMPAVLAEFPNARLLIVGTGELKQDLQSLSVSLGLQERVLFTGAIPNLELPEYFATADIFIGPSIQADGGDTEGFGLTFVEAAMSGCLVVASDVGGISDIITDGKTGFLVREKDPSAIADALMTILGRLDSFAGMRTTAREEMISRFDWQVVAEKYRQVLTTM